MLIDEIVDESELVAVIVNNFALLRYQVIRQNCTEIPGYPIFRIPNFFFTKLYPISGPYSISIGDQYKQILKSRF